MAQGRYYQAFHAPYPVCQPPCAVLTLVPPPGRRLQLQHLLLRHPRQQGTPPPSQERPQETAHPAAPRCHQGPRYCRGSKPACPLHPCEADRRHQTETYIYIATERVVPLRWHVRRKSLSPETIKWGLNGIAVDTSLFSSLAHFDTAIMLTRHSAPSSSSTTTRPRFTGASRSVPSIRLRAASGSWAGLRF